MELRVGLFRHLQKMVAKMGLPIPAIIKNEKITGHNEIVISMDLSKYPIADLSQFAREQKLFIGNHPDSSVMAEYRAVMCVQKCLQQCLSVQFNDFSLEKNIVLKSNINHEAIGIKDLITRISTFMRLYQSSNKLIDPHVNGVSSNPSAFVRGLGKELSDLCISAQVSFENTEKEVESTTIDVRSELRTSVEAYKEHVVVCDINEKDFLSDILSYLNLPPANYINELLSTGLFCSTCSLEIDQNLLGNKDESTTFQGDCKNDVHEAESSAARCAVRMLERNFSFEVADFNYEDLLSFRTKHERLVNLRKKLEDSVSEGYRSWKSFSLLLHSFVYKLYGLHQSYLLEPECTHDYAPLYGIANDLEQEIYQIWQMQDKATKVVPVSNK